MVISSTQTQSLTQILEYLISDNFDHESLLIFDNISWENYNNLTNNLGDSPYFKLSYNANTLQVMSPSRRHEADKKLLGILLETYFLETGTRFYPLGSTTFKSENLAKGIEPDQCYCIGTEKEIPDLAIEIIITSGGINSLTIYQGLGVPEVWFYQSQSLTIYHLEHNEYIAVNQSQLLPHLDLDLLTTSLQWDDPFDAVVAFKSALQPR